MTFSRNIVGHNIIFLDLDSKLGWKLIEEAEEKAKQEAKEAEKKKQEEEKKKQEEQGNQSQTSQQSQSR